MNYSSSFFIGLAILIIATMFGRHNEHTEILAAIKDSGCSTHPHKVIEQKDMSDIYDRSHLGGT